MHIKVCYAHGCILYIDRFTTVGRLKKRAPNNGMHVLIPCNSIVTERQPVVDLTQVSMAKMLAL